MVNGRLAGLAALVGLTATACGIGGSSSTGSDTSGRDATRLPATCGGEPEPAERVEPGLREDVPSALDDPEDDAFPEPLVDVDEIISGGPPPDGIPAIDEPTFLEACAIDWLGAREPVTVLEVGGEVRGYPVQILTWHEIVNDVVAEVPVTVTYCPLCNSAFAYEREVGDRVLDFGTSGSLFRSNVVMYDRQTESLWVQLRHEAVAGELAGTPLETIPMQTISWADFREAHPDALVLSRETGFSRDYGANPYGGYDDVDQNPFLFRGEIDGRLAAMTRIVGIVHDGEPVAVLTDDLLEEQVMDVEIAGERVVVLGKPGTASALDTTSIPDGRDVGATGVFLPVVDGQALSFEDAAEEFRDLETGSTWNILGEAVAGPLEGQKLEALVHDDTLWFAWAAFEPDTRVVPE